MQAGVKAMKVWVGREAKVNKMMKEAMEAWVGGKRVEEQEKIVP
jgi:hypothetical protein